SVRIYRDRWRVPEVFLEIQRAGNVSDREMFYTFNMGIGMVIIIDGRRTIDIEGVDFYIIGEVVEGDKKVEIV
ncbi:MAG TPA: phosphoribosylformylglycinamidine cyclo-ligase, partial [Firmicutes bacterium]|nr:phosphoribosylformylglycinamidine cyclo-ligase [Bacillota bacterium]